MRAGSLRVGVIGCGASARALHLPALRRLRHVEVAAVADPSSAARAHAGRLAPGAELSDSADALIARPEIDAVVVCAPNAVHAELGLAVLAARKHLYLEKPVATTIADARRLVEAGETRPVIAACGFNRRFHPLFQRVRALVGSGVIGQVRGASSAFCEPLAGTTLPAWKRRRDTGGGALLDLGSHHLDLLPWLLGSEIERIEAELRSDDSEHDSALLRIGLRDGLAASTFLSFRSGRVDSFELYGDRGMLRIDRYARTITVRRAPAGAYATRRRPVAPTAALAWWRLRSVVRPASEPSYRRALRAFVAAARGEDVELPTLRDGLRSLEAVAAAELSADRGRPVPVTEVR